MALSRQQTNVARKIIVEGQARNAPRHVIRVALAAALTEANLLNPRHGDADSVGPFQERASQGWGTPEQLRRVRYQAGQFYDRAVPLFHQGVRGGALAQAVERSAFPGRYQPNLGTAGQILRGLSERVAGGAQAAATTKEPRVTTQTSAQVVRAPVQTASLPNPLPTDLPIAGPTLPQGSIGAQPLGSPQKKQQTSTGQTKPVGPTVPATPIAQLQQQAQVVGKKRGESVPASARSVPAPRPVKGLQPGPVRTALGAAKEIAGRPYVWGGGHGGFKSRGYDCSGAVSYVLHKLGVLSHPLTSGAMGSVLKPGPGEITVFYNAGHTFMRFQTPHGFVYWGTSVGDSGSGGLGKHPAPDASYLSQYKVGHVPGVGGAQAAAIAGASQPAHGVHPQADTVKINKGIHTQQPRFSSTPILSDLAPAPGQGPDLLAQSQKPHVPLSVRRIGAGRKRSRPRRALRVNG